jgi:hypothetical protein
MAERGISQRRACRLVAVDPKTVRRPALPDAPPDALRKTRHRGLARVGWMLTLSVAAHNLVRLPKPLAAT